MLEGMKLYHFCGTNFIPGIQRYGLTKGVFPVVTRNGPRFCHNRQWLTEEPDPEQQSWAKQILLRYSRTAYRLTVTIPERYVGNLIRATDYVRTMPPERRKVVTDWPGSDKWWLYIGSIPPDWITEIVRLNDMPERFQHDRKA